MDRKNTWIVILTISAFVLLAAFAFDTRHQAMAQQAVQNGDYTLVSVPVQAGGTALYVVDNKAGLMAIFTYDNNARTLKPRKVGSLDEAFPLPKN